MSQESKHKVPRQTMILTFALVVAAVLLILALTWAWLFQNKGLQTMTKIQFQYLKLKGQETDTISVELGNIDVREAGEKRIPFCVEASQGAQFKLQLGYTTNLPLTYQIVEVTNWANWEKIAANEATVVNGNYLNKDNNSNIANDTKHGATYEQYEEVQKNAEPIYWQSERLDHAGVDKNYILIVSWKKCDDTVTDKDTDMIYLTAGLVGDTASLSTGDTSGSAGGSNE